MSEAAKYHALRRRIKGEIKICQRMYSRLAMKNGYVQAFWTVWDNDRLLAERLEKFTLQHEMLYRLLVLTEPNP